MQVDSAIACVTHNETEGKHVRKIHRLPDSRSGWPVGFFSQPPKRKVEFEIKIEEGAVPPSKPTYRLSPKEHDELQAQIDELLTQGHIRASSSPYGAPLLLFLKRMDGGACAWIIEP